MKKILTAALALALAAGCSGGNAGSTPAASGSSATGITSEDAYYVFTSDLKTTDYLITQNSADHEINMNLIDGLLEVNSKNQYVGAIAESWEPNEDASVWTFHIRKGANWVTNTGEIYDEVKADDFVAGLQHAADFDSATLWLATSVIKGLSEYKNGGSWDEVGVKAIDDYTLEYTLTNPASYFDTMTNYSIFYPVNREFLEAQGAGCKLGAPDVNNCGFGQPTEPGTILYNGGYILDSFVSKSEERLHKNENYWDAEHVYINNVTRVYNDGSDPAFTVKGFQQSENPFYQAILLATSDNFAEYLKQYEANAYNAPQNQYSFGINFNLNRITYNTTKKDAGQQADARKAILNSNFRLAMKYGLDRVSYLSTVVDPSIASKAIRNMECPYQFVKMSDGTSYGDIVAQTSALGEDLSEGQDPFYKPDKAAEYMAKAKEELSDCTFPIHLDLMFDNTDSASGKQAASLKQSIEASCGAENIVIDTQPVDPDTYEKSAYTSTGPVDADWDISTSTGWGYDYIDPKTYLNIFSPVNGDVTRTSMGLEFKGTEDSDAQNEAAIEASGLNKYQELLDAADAITGDTDARYKAYAVAECFLLDTALYIPVQTQSGSVNWRISRVEPFSAGWQSSKFKNMIIHKDPITAEYYNAKYEEWLKG